MSLFLPEGGYFPSDPRAVPSGAARNAFVDGVYAKLSPVYDWVFGAPLQPGRVAAVERLAIRPGDRVLEVGVGTGINATLYPRHCRVTAIDLSASMLARARARIECEGLRHVRLLGADAARLAFPDEAFDSVCAPYVVSVVPYPERAVREMHRVCRRGGRIVILNHFRSANRFLARVERAISPLTVHAGFQSDLDLATLLRDTGARAISVEKVNYPRIWTLVTCIKE